MRSLRWAVFVVGLAQVLLLASQVTAAPRVEFELVMVKGTPPTAAHDWLAMMKDVDQQGLRIRGIGVGDEPGISSSGKGDTAVHRVMGIITDANVLLLPGASIRLGDKRGISTWIGRLKEGGGEEGMNVKRGAFGLTSQQLVTIHEALSARITFNTRGLPAKTVVQKMVNAITPEVSMDESVERAFAEGGDVADELQGVTAGTALAAVLRPLGLVIVPEKGAGNRVQLLITDVRRSEQNWPVGWPSEKSTTDTIPNLLKFLNVEITDTPITEALAAVQQRVDVPFLYDHNALARQRIDLEKVKISVPGGKTFYGKILDKMLWPAKLSWEVRLDESQRPFIWITTKIK